MQAFQSGPNTIIFRIIIILPEDAVHEDNQAGNAGEDQHLGEESQPGEVEGDLDSVISPHGVQWLELVPVTKSTPLQVQLAPV